MPQPDPRDTFNYYLDVQQDYQSIMVELLTRTSRELERDIAAAGKGENISSKIGVEQMLAVKRVVDEQLFTFSEKNKKILEEYVGVSAAAASNAFGAYEQVLLSNVMTKKAVAEYLASAAQTARIGVEAAKKRVMGDSYIPLSTAVYGTDNLMSGMVDKYLETALARGLSARDIAKGVKSMMNPAVPGGLSYAAMRLGRTEINNAFHAVSQEKYLDSPYVTGVEWHLSGSHPEGDECDDMAEQSPYAKDKVPDKPHPMCFCFITPEMMGEDEFLDSIFGPENVEPTEETFVDPGVVAKDIPIKKLRALLDEGMLDIASLSPDERGAVIAYTGLAARRTNMTLREGGVSAVTDILDKLMGKSTLPENIEVYRKIPRANFPIPLDQLDGAAGLVLRDKAYLSTSARYNGYAEGSSEDIRLDITVPKGTSGLWVRPVSQVKDEDEIILPRDLPLLITEVVKTKPDWSGRYSIIVRATVAEVKK